MVMDTDTVIGKVLLTVLLLGLAVFAAAVPAAAQSMIPDDFDWSVYGVVWDESDFENWGTNTQQNFYYESQPFTYDWSGTTYEFDPYAQYNTPQYDDTGWNYTVPQSGSRTSGEQSGSDEWFYQDMDSFYDDFTNWTSTGNLPESAYVSGFVGYQQSYTLDCEARSAVDLAAYFGVNISHSDFLNRLPKSDDPNEGFVGSYYDKRGKIPPASYGVYEKPVAVLLQQYGLDAVGVYGYSENALKAQIAAGRPVMVWVVGNTELGYPVSYTASSTGRTTAVVPYQHTVVVIGYDKNTVTIQDGGMKYTRDWNTFLVSWGVLGNRAIYID